MRLPHLIFIMEYLLIHNRMILLLSAIYLSSTVVLSCGGIQGMSGRRCNILVSMTDPTSMHSHTRQLAAISRALLQRGHSITVLVPSNKGIKGFEGAFNQSIIYDVAFEQSDVDEMKTEMVKIALGIKSAGWNPLSIVQRYLGFFSMSCIGLFGTPSIFEELDNFHFDLLIHIAINPCDFLVAEHLNLPYVSLTSSIRFALFDEDTVSIPLPSSYVPFSLDQPLTDEMSFLQRTSNFISRNVIIPLIKIYAYSLFRDIQMKYNVSVDKPFNELISGSKLWLAHTDFSLDFARPTSPDWIPVGGLLPYDPKPVSQDLESFVEGAGKHGVIIFSLGSMVTSLMDDDLNELFAKVFSELPQRVLWRYVGPKPRNLGDNTRVMEWLPQNDLLGHPQTRLLIYHGGINGVFEALYHKVPMVLLPIFADQPAMGARVTKKGMGVVLDRAKLTHDTVKGAIGEVINNPKYKANVEHYGSIHHDSIASPLDTAVFWIEHVLKFGGDHLRLRGRDLNFFVLNSFDVLAFFFVICLVIVYVDYLILRTCYRCCCARGNEKPKSD